MSWIEADAGPGLLLIGLAVFLLIGVFTLSGAWALIIWALIGVVAAFIVYAIGVRLARWARGDWSPRRNSGGSSGPPQGER